LKKATYKQVIPETKFAKDWQNDFEKVNIEVNR
jgi:hypothetical protein